MVGDWFRFRYTIDGKEIVKTFRISRTADDIGYVWGDGFGRMCVPERLEPIPLTAEILKKNGFEYYHKNFASTDYDSPFKLEMVEWPDENGNGGLWLIKGLFKIRFVHELQHALRLCGIDKEIVI